MHIYNLMHIAFIFVQVVHTLFTDMVHSWDSLIYSHATRSANKNQKNIFELLFRLDFKKHVFEKQGKQLVDSLSMSDPQTPRYHHHFS